MNMHTYQHTVQQNKKKKKKKKQTKNKQNNTKILQKTLTERWAKLEVAQARVRSQKKKVKTMHDLLTSLKDKKLIPTEQKILDHNFSGIAKKLIESHIANAKLQPNLNCYSDEVKHFAMTLH